MTLLIRWLNSTDEAAVLDIDRQSFPPEMSWDIEDVKRCFDGKHYGLVAVLDGLVIGYCVTRRHRSRPVLVSVATLPAFRRRGIATVLFREIAARHQARRLYTFPSERNLIAHLWLRKLGWQAAGIKHNFYGPGHEAYEFCWKRPTPALTSDIMSDRMQE